MGLWFKTRSQKRSNRSPKQPAHNKSKRKGKGSASKGWKNDSPKKGKQRKILFNKCGKGCLLMPSRLGFPVCQKCKMGICTCRADCRGILAAKIRASQWKHNIVKVKADALGKKSECSWSK